MSSGLVFPHVDAATHVVHLGPFHCAHLWDNVALCVAVALLEHWGVTALAWPNDEDHTLGWLADAP
jgi:hypothetical protein